MNENNSYTLLFSSLSNKWGALQFDKRQSYEFSLEVCTIERRKQNFFYIFVNYYAFQVFAYMNREPKNDVISNKKLSRQTKR
jgi:hypothetical protein